MKPLSRDEQRIHDGLYYRATARLEYKYLDLIDSQILKPAQRPVWEAYRTYFDAAFRLGFVDISNEQGEQVRALSPKVVEQVAQAANGVELHRKRVDVLVEQAIKTIVNDDQRKKYAALKVESDAIERQLDAAEQQQRGGAGGASTQPIK